SLRSGMADDLLHEDSVSRYVEFESRRCDRRLLVGCLDVAQPGGLAAADGISDPGAGFTRQWGTGAHTRSVVYPMPRSGVRPHPPPQEQILPAWRAAVLAYRATGKLAVRNRTAFADGLAAFRQVLPEMPEREVRQEVVLAIADAAREHPAWF